MEISEDGRALLFVSGDDIDENGFFRVPDSVISIEDYAAASNARTKLKTLDLNNTKHISYSAFTDCQKLVSVIGHPTEIDECAFCHCLSLKTFPFFEVKLIGPRAFKDSGIDDDITEGAKIVFVNHKGCEAFYAKNDCSHYAVKISRIIDVNKDLYADLFGNPFIIDTHGKNVELLKERERFLKLANKS